MGQKRRNKWSGSEMSEYTINFKFLVILLMVFKRLSYLQTNTGIRKTLTKLKSLWKTTCFELNILNLKLCLEKINKKKNCLFKKWYGLTSSSAFISRQIELWKEGSHTVRKNWTSNHKIRQKLIHKFHYLK